MFVTLKVKTGRDVLGPSTQANKPPPLPLFDDRPERDLKFLVESSGVNEEIQENLHLKPENKPFFKRLFDTWRIRLL